MNGSLEYPPYFAEVTAGEPTPLWILPNSHRYVAKSEEVHKVMATCNDLRLIYVPVWSIIIVRGDVQHAGGSGKMAAKWKSTGLCPRSHQYVGRENMGLPDSINDAHPEGYKPNESDKKIKGSKSLYDRVIPK